MVRVLIVDVMEYNTCEPVNSVKLARPFLVLYLGGGRGKFHLYFLSKNQFILDLKNYLYNTCGGRTYVFLPQPQPQPQSGVVDDTFPDDHRHNTTIKLLTKYHHHLIITLSPSYHLYIPSNFRDLFKTHQIDRGW